MSADSTQPTGTPTWFKSSHSGGNQTECVEAAFVAANVLVRDSKQPGHGQLKVSAEAWQNFLSAARQG
ncbi:DUF397 domain-containing protein [Streptomyces lincolnensis]|uniref:DUF397 domain-containing protein n=1 Tax=Streptomyces lincolnensis TaxID=1915 RepID=UPI0008363CC4|nr:DUF397 domain-containing protein [Streptomyces lincolnensis]QMV09084.1 DUF397 domain-containing protein [Streptomyces lincolnensis]